DRQWIQAHDAVPVSDARSAAQSVRRFEQQTRSEEHTSELQSPCKLVCRLLLEKKNDLLRGEMVMTNLVEKYRDMKKRGEKVTALTAYDYPTARLVDDILIDFILAGDSLHFFPTRRSSDLDRQWIQAHDAVPVSDARSAAQSVRRFEQQT